MVSEINRWTVTTKRFYTCYSGQENEVQSTNTCSNQNAVRIRPLNLFSASSVDLHGASNTNVLRNNLRVRLSPIKSPVLRKYLNPFKRPSMYPSISKYTANSCNCCIHLCTNNTITSSVNGRTFSVINNSDLD